MATIIEWDREALEQSLQDKLITIDSLFPIFFRIEDEVMSSSYIDFAEQKEVLVIGDPLALLPFAECVYRICEELEIIQQIALELIWHKPILPRTEFSIERALVIDLEAYAARVLEVRAQLDCNVRIQELRLVRQSETEHPQNIISFSDELARRRQSI